MVNSLDIKSAFLQGGRLRRNVYLKPPQEANSNKLWKLNKCVYGLTDASRMWYLRVSEVMTELKLQKITLDEAMYICKKDKTVEGILCIHVDDFIWAGNIDFKHTVIDKLKDIFCISKESSENFKFLGLQVMQTKRKITVDQSHYVNSLEEPEIITSGRKKDEVLNTKENKSMKQFVGQLAWAASITRPDIAYETCEAIIGGEKRTISEVFKAKKALRKLKSNTLSLNYIPLEDLESCNLIVYADASHANLKDESSQSGCIIFLMDKNDKVNVSRHS